MAKEKEEERAWAPEVIDMLSRMSNQPARASTPVHL